MFGSENLLVQDICWNKIRPKKALRFIGLIPRNFYLLRVYYICDDIHWIIIIRKTFFFVILLSMFACYI